MADLNKWIGSGRVTRDTELRFTPAGTAVADVGLCSNRIWYSKDKGGKQEEPCFLDITLWGKQAENCSKYLEKGRRVLIEGKMKMNSWEKDGKKYSKLFCVADKVTFLNGESQNGEQGDAVKSGGYDTKPSKQEINKQEVVENSEEDYNIDDIPF